MSFQSNLSNSTHWRLHGYRWYINAVLQIWFKESDYTSEYWLSREKVWCILRTCIVQSIVPLVGWFSWTVKHSSFLLMKTTSLSIFDGLFIIGDCCYFEKATCIYLYRDVGFFHQFDWAYVSPFSKVCFLNEHWQTQQLKEAHLHVLFNN